MRVLLDCWIKWARTPSTQW